MTPKKTTLKNGNRPKLGKYLRHVRESRAVSLRSLAKTSGVAPSYLSKIERGIERASEEAIVGLAQALGANAHLLLAMEGRVSSRLHEIICKRPAFYAELLEEIDAEIG